MTRRTRVSGPGLQLRQWGTAPLGSMILALLIGVAVFCTAAAPRALEPLADAELHDELGSLTEIQSDLTFVGVLGDGTFGLPDGVASAFDDLDSGIRNVSSVFDGPLSRLASDAPGWFTQLDVVATSTDANGRGPNIRPTADPGYLDRVRFIDGAPPAEWSDDFSAELRPEDRPPIDIAVSKAAAKVISASVGSVFVADPVPFRISGIYEALDPADSHWLHDPVLLTPRLTEQVLGGDDIVDISAYLAPDSLNGLRSEAQGATLTVWYPTEPGAVRFAETGALLLQLRQFDTVGLRLATGQELRFTSSLPAAIEAARGRVAAVSALLALAASAPLGVVFAVLLLAAQGVAARREATLRMAASRGAGAVRVRGMALTEGLVIALPTGALGVAAALIVFPTASSPGALMPAVVVALLLPAYFLATGMPAGSGRIRSDLGSRRRSRLRGMLEIGVIGLTIIAVVLLFRRGLSSTDSAVVIDPLLAATPLLLSLSVSVIVLRLYPIPLIGLQRRARRRRSAVALLGAARAVRDPAIGFASALAIVVAVSAAVFSGVLALTVTTGVSTAAREEVGADIRIDGSSLAPLTVGELTGVRAATALALTPNTDARSNDTRVLVTLIVADVAELSAIRPDIPSVIQSEGDDVPFLMSTELDGRLRGSDIQIGGVAAVRAGELDPSVMPGAGPDWLLVDRADAARLVGANAVPNRILVTVSPQADIGATADLVAKQVVTGPTDTGPTDTGPTDTGPTITDVASVAHRIESRPSIGVLISTLWVAAAVALLLGAVAIAVAVVAASTARNRTIAVMSMLGASRRQLRGIVVWEIVPVLVVAGLAGLALGLGLPFLVAGLVDLRTFVGGSTPVAPDIPILIVTAITLGFLAAAALVGSLAVAIARRVDPASELKIGAT